MFDSGDVAGTSVADAMNLPWGAASVFEGVGAELPAAWPDFRARSQ